ncbi:gtr1 g protein gtr2 [Moniliophthora roreri MCA 2997]|uniref:GTP-binding protein n=1 Tax=Moniliophthora roreri (strain MCA 2997) TaxID=1381753 RepID=V2YQR8_MONRO|nr:gtr1 g protein gtr2 [Moniliophthora roreri MCA 2997]
MTSYPSYSATSSSSRPSQNASKASSTMARTKILLLGLRRSGKTSIQQVLFNDLPPKECFYLDATMRIVKHTYDTIIPLEIWDCPGNITVETLGAPLSQFPTLIFVIDIRDLYNQPISKLVDFIKESYRQNPNINLEVFVHKAEKLHEDDKIENFRQIHERVTDRLLDEGPDYDQMPLNFHLTSIYDHTLHEAFSRVLQKSIGSLPYIEDLLNIFCANSQSPKAFLFDTKSRLYIATDASPVDSATHNLCCDNLAMLNSFAPLYRSASASPQRHRRPLPPTPPPSASSSSSLSPDPQALSPGLSSDLSTPTTPKVTTIVINSKTDNGATPSSERKFSKELFYPCAATSLYSSPPGTTLTCHVITEQLVLIALLPTTVFEGRRGLVEYNVVFFREGVQEICDVEREARGG